MLWPGIFSAYPSCWLATFGSNWIAFTRRGLIVLSFWYFLRSLMMSGLRLLQAYFGQKSVALTEASRRRCGSCRVLLKNSYGIVQFYHGLCCGRFRRACATWQWSVYWHYSKDAALVHRTLTGLYQRLFLGKSNETIYTPSLNFEKP